MMIFGFLTILSILVLGIPQDPGQFAIAGLLGVILVVGGAQSIFLGAVGEYVGRTLLLSAGKPQAVIRSVEVSNFGPEG
jgi:hypothetical protein